MIHSNDLEDLEQALRDALALLDSTSNMLTDLEDALMKCENNEEYSRAWLAYEYERVAHILDTNNSLTKHIIKEVIKGLEVNVKENLYDK